VEEVAMIGFYDLGEKCRGFVSTRSGAGKVAFAVSLENNGDIDVYLTAGDARAIARALVSAADRADGGPSAV
jgi:hypothetical protein